uniref:Arabinogalactan peptide 16 n=1 Tax=Aegilops tauschii subsp. strangulata TaxID=200361 RepID=A0A452Y3S6_AEGTS
MARTLFGFVVAAALVLAVFMPALAAAQAPAPAPTSDGESSNSSIFPSELFFPSEFPLTCFLSMRAASSVDQGVAYFLMILALVLTYLIHPLDASSPYKLF